MKQPIQNKGITLKELAFLGVYSALLIAFKEMMNVLPNIEPVTVMLIALTTVFGIKALLPVYVFSFIEIILHGFHIWNMMYLYVWAVLVLIVLCFLPLHKVIEAKTGKASPVLLTVMWTVLAALYGIGYGTLCSIPYFITLGTEGAISWIISGFTFDILHCVGNSVITSLLFFPLYKILKVAKKKLA
jgi:energy-coupling factor transport system substrate-specific component